MPLTVPQVLTWSEPNTYCSEPLFVGNPGGRGEDDGLLLCSLLWGKPRVASTAVLVLNARDLSLVARSEVLGRALHCYFSILYQEPLSGGQVIGVRARISVASSAVIIFCARDFFLVARCSVLGCHFQAPMF